MAGPVPVPSLSAVVVTVKPVGLAPYVPVLVALLKSTRVEDVEVLMLKPKTWPAVSVPMVWMLVFVVLSGEAKSGAPLFPMPMMFVQVGLRAL